MREEVGYWADWIGSGGGKWAEDFAFRFDSESEVEDPALRAALAATSATEVTILDVGAGPATAVGRRYPGKRLSVVAVDPLGDRYAKLLRRAGISPPVWTERLEGEELERRFGRDRFDIAYARNSLDHSVDPVLIVEQMLAVVRPGGKVVLRHGRNEAVVEDYVQLHQWNFDLDEGHFVIWRPGQRTDMTERLAGSARVSGNLEEDGWISCEIEKL